MMHHDQRNIGRWTWCGESIPPAGVHRTAGQYVETMFKLGRFQHFDGKTWGAVALDPAEAATLADTPSQFPPTYWLEPQGEFA